MDVEDENLDMLMRKYSSGKAERDLAEYYAELYASLKTLDKLERGYSRGLFSSTAAKQEYEAQCKSLISQCTINHQYIRHVFPSIDNFVRTYSMMCHRAVLRLQRRLPATLEHSDGGLDPSDRKAVRDVNEATELLISLMDVVRLGEKAVDALIHPTDSALNALRRVNYLTPELAGRETLTEWSVRLHGLRAADAIDDEEARQFVLDIENAYREFKETVAG